jgi:hypothetical protein
MGCLRRLDRFRLEPWTVGKWFRTPGDYDDTVPANVWVLTDGLVVTPAIAEGEPPTGLRDPDLGTLTPEMIIAACPRGVRLDGDRVTRVSLRPAHRWLYRGAQENSQARFKVVGRTFIVPVLFHESAAEEVADLLRDVYGPRFIA